MKTFFAVLVLAPAVASAQEWASKPSDELCITLASKMISGDISYRQELTTELESRGEECAPADMYIKMAQARLEFQHVRAAGEQQAVIDAQQKAEDRAARIRSAGQALLLLQAQRDAERRQNRPLHTTCQTSDTTGVTDCTTTN